MEEKLKSWGWYYVGACSCSPKKYKYKHAQHTEYTVRVIRKYNAFELRKRNHTLTQQSADMLEAALKAEGLL